MAASSTDVRAWLIEQGETPPQRGPIPERQRQLYAEAHPADSDDVSGADPLNIAAAGTGGTAAGEQAPRRIKGTPLIAGARERLWGPRGRPGAGGRARPGRGKHARVSLATWAEDLWGDLAYMAAPLPPVQKVLYLQAPYAGPVVESSLKGTAADAALQPIARNMQAVKAINGLVGPPVFVAGILLLGGRVQVPVVDADGTPVTDPRTGQPAMRSEFDQRTKMMFLGLRYSLLSMSSLPAQQVAAVRASADERLARSRAMDAHINWIFDMTPPPEGTSVEDEALQRLGDVIGDQAPAAGPAAGAPVDGRLVPPGTPVPPADSYPYGTPPQSPGFMYPPAPGMDAAGADPGRSLAARGAGRADLGGGGVGAAAGGGVLRVA